ncbi:Tryptophanyl-tR synthetase-like protein [Daphnia sinensis]|uniref:Tryptophanyl-tR synthetase-like protein n=1 Tax=Daphnia sinensis TaxID=1820382 RepID=A0AAD5PSA8_9CRUS|nr:Tryptophanyl-tR synthetase-like protein [Daphnia sinensis]
MMSDRTSPTTAEYAVRIPASFVSSMRDSSFAQPTPLRNLHKDFMDLSEEMQVYVRIKPCEDKSSTLSIVGNHIIVNPPKDSVSFKNRNNAGTKTLQKFKFNKIYDASINQDYLFKDSALNLVQDFLMGKNTLLFTYGATSAGKTYTMLGSVRDAGLIPRSLDVVFNSIEDRLLKSPILKPLALNEVMKLNHNQIDAEEVERAILMRGFDLDASDTKESKESISSVSSGSLKDWNIRGRDTTVCALQHPRDYYSVWVSYCEIYNEQAFDLLDGCDKKKKRVALRITEDRKGKFFVKGLKEIYVRSADDAVRVLLFGKENLHFAATKLNHNSSRSHCLFTVKLIRTNHCDEPSEAAINMMSFVDLAGMERTTKTQSRGERLKEAGNINTSLLILGRCIDAMRNNQQNVTNKTMIPYRESKLTRVLQHFFVGQGRAAMFVNVSPSANLCDETLHVLKFGALAQEVIIQPDRDVSVADLSISQFAPPVRPSRFQQFVRKSISLLSARASILETSAFQIIGEEDDPQERIQALEEELARLKADWEENEQKVRDECCNEWTEVITKLEKSWNQRYEDTKARYEEFCENRVDLMAQLMNNCVKKKRKVTQEEDLEHYALKFKDKDDRIQILEDSNQHLNELVEKLKSSLKVSEESRSNLQKEMTRLQFEVASSNKPKINFCGPDVDEEGTETQPENLLAKLQEELAAKEEMLNEAAFEYHTKCEEMTKIQQENEQLIKQLAVTNEELTNVQSQLEQSNLLLTNANERLDVREEELMNMEERLMKANGQFGNLNTELREAKRRIRDLESRMKDQTNASMVSTLCEDLQKQLLEAENKLEKRKDEIHRLNKELSHKDCVLAKGPEIQEELENLRDQLSKSQIQLSITKKELAALQEANEDMKARRESLLDQISHLKKDLELSSTERKHDEGSHSHLLEENEKMRRNINELRDSQVKLAEENADFQKAMAEYEFTVEELTTQMGQLKEIKRERGLLEEELKTLAATLGRVQLEKSQMEKEIATRTAEFDEIQLTVKLLNVSEQNEKLRSQVEQSRIRESALNEELQGLKKQLLSASENDAGSASTIASKEAELSDTKEKLEAMKITIENKSALEKDLNEKLDQLEKDNEKLTKQMLKHMRRANELTETHEVMEEKLRVKTQKCDSLSNRLIELENESSKFANIQTQLREYEIALKEKEKKIESLIEELEEKTAAIENMKMLNERVLQEKNEDIDRLEHELKSILSGHVNYKEPVPTIKIEELMADEQNLDGGSPMMVTPTPVKARRGRAKKNTSPGAVQIELDENKTETASLCGSTRSRRTLKTEFAAPPSITKSSARKPRKAKSECDEVAHPAHLSVPHSEEVDSNEVDSTTLGHTSKRRLYNAKCPDILLPSTKKEEGEGIDFPKRMATRSRKPQ